MDTWQILVVDDDNDLALFIKEYLEAKNLLVHTCSSGKMALAYLKNNTPNLCILDVMMPMMDGFDLAAEIRKLSSEMPFLFLTGQNEKQERLRGLRLGAEDYILKPFSLEELFLRIGNILKRVTPEKKEKKPESLIALGKLIFDTNYQSVTHKENVNKLSGIENKLLAMLCANLNKQVDRDFILTEIWGETDEYKSKSLNVYITRLRKILAPDPSIELLNLHGQGYKLVCN